MPDDRFNATQTAASLINRHGARAEAHAAQEMAAARARGEEGTAARWREVAQAVRALDAVAPLASRRFDA